MELNSPKETTEHVMNHALTLQGIKDFVECLCDVFVQKRQTPLGRYKRLIKYVIETDEATLKFIKGFQEFFTLHPTLADIDQEVRILYAPKIFIPIGYF